MLFHYSNALNCENARALQYESYTSSPRVNSRFQKILLAGSIQIYALALELQEPKQIWKALLVITTPSLQKRPSVFRNQTLLVIKY